MQVHIALTCSNLELPITVLMNSAPAREGISNSATILEDREEGLSVRARVERASSVKLVRIPKEVWVLAALVQERCKVRSEFRPQKVPVAWPSAK